MFKFVSYLQECSAV